MSSDVLTMWPNNSRPLISVRAVLAQRGEAQLLRHSYLSCYL